MALNFNLPVEVMLIFEQDGCIQDDVLSGSMQLTDVVNAPLNLAAWQAWQMMHYSLCLDVPANPSQNALERGLSCAGYADTPQSLAPL